MYPRYSYPPRAVASAAASFIFGGRRSFHHDGLECIRNLQPPLQVLGRENIPAAGPCLLVFNHYYRPGFHAWWMTFALAAVVPEEVHFIMTNELTFPGKWYALFGRFGSRLLLRRISRMYGFTSMPPMPPRPRDVKARAESVREMLSFAREHPHAFLGLAPEGGDQPGGVLSFPVPGAGRFIILLTHSGTPILPVGIYEEAGCLCLSFGKPYRPEPVHSAPADERDRLAIEAVMCHIAMQLPPRLRGEFG